MTYRQRFTDGGMWGAVLFVAGPFAFAIGYAWAINQGGFDRMSPIAALIMLAGCLANLISIPMMIVGRELVREDEGGN